MVIDAGLGNRYNQVEISANMVEKEMKENIDKGRR
jgi:hypothetical protein